MRRLAAAQVPPPPPSAEAVLVGVSDVFAMATVTPVLLLVEVEMLETELLEHAAAITGPARPKSETDKEMRLLSMMDDGPRGLDLRER